MLFPIIAVAQSNIPSTPFTGFFSEQRSTANKITRKFYDGRGSLYFQEDIVYKRSKDGLIDTLVHGNNSTEIRVYNLENQLEHYESFFNFSPEKVEVSEYYTYNSDGSIKQIDAILSTTTYYNTSASSSLIMASKFNDYLNKKAPYSKDIIEYRPYGYDCTSFEYDFEKEDYKDTPQTKKYYFTGRRLLKVEAESILGNYISDQYEYDANGYTHTCYERKDAPYYKYKYTFNTKGDIVETIYYKWGRIDEMWAIEAIYKYDYAYPSTTGTELICKENKVYYSDGSIVAITDAPTPLYIFNMQGRLIRKVNLVLGENRLPLNKGLYIVKYGDVAQKIVCN